MKIYPPPTISQSQAYSRLQNGFVKLISGYNRTVELRHHIGWFDVDLLKEVSDRTVYLDDAC